MRRFIFIIIIIFLISSVACTAAKVLAQSLDHRLAGYILKAVQSRGEAWYVNPADGKRYYLGRPADAFLLMQSLGTGIANNDLYKIPVGIIAYDDRDDDNDGLSNRFERALGTNPKKTDTDNDGYADKNEIENNYNPLNTSSLPIDDEFADNNSGKIFLQIESRGEAWYVNPADGKRYYLGRPADAWQIMRKFSLGITNQNLSRIKRQYLPINTSSPPKSNPTPAPKTPTAGLGSPNASISGAAAAIRGGNSAEAIKYFTPELTKAIEYTMNFLGADGRFILGNILSGSILSSQTDTEAIYANEIYFSLGGYKVPVKFTIKKQPDGSWLIANL